MPPDPLTQLENAREAIAAERDRSLCEQNAFRAFVERVEDLEPATTDGDFSPTETPGLPQIRHDSSVATTDAVWAAYRETVVAVPHFETDYVETPLEHLRRELGDDVAALVTDSEELTQYHQRVIGSRVELAITKREQQLEKMDEEAAMLNQAEELVIEATAALGGRDTDTVLGMSQGEIEDAVTELEQFIHRCEQLLTDRQEQLDNRPEAKRLDRESTVGYLYRNLDVNYPVIVALTTVLDRLQSLTSDLQAAMPNR